MLPAILFICGLFTIVSCKKNIDSMEAGRSSAYCEDCAAFYGNEMKPKYIEIKDTGVIQDQYYLYYTKTGLLDSISHIRQEAKGTRETIKLQYPDQQCIPSGYIQSTIYSNGELEPIICAFLTDGKFIVRKNIFKWVGQQDDSDSSASFEYIYNSAGYMNNRKWYYNGRFGQSYVGSLMIFNGSSNLNYIAAWGNYTYELSLQGYDNKSNPFHFQKNILYYLSILPYNIFPEKGEIYGADPILEHYNLFDHIILSKHNVKKLELVLEGFSYIVYTLEYQYNEFGYPLLITIHRAYSRFPGFNVSRELSEEIRIRYR